MLASSTGATKPPSFACGRKSAAKQNPGIDRVPTIVQLGSRPKSSIVLVRGEHRSSRYRRPEEDNATRQSGGWRRPWRSADFDKSGALFEAKFMLPWVRSAEEGGS